MRKLLTAILFMVLLPLCGKTQDSNNDKARISILTVEPWGREIRAVFGHSAIRVNDPSTGYDRVFSYGAFGFDSLKFIIRLMKGKIDYMLEEVDYSEFWSEYHKRGSDIIEQVIQLTDEEVIGIINYLDVNMKPENRKYHYNVFKENCSTKIYDLIKKNINGSVYHSRQYESLDDKKFSLMVSECLINKPWTKLGINLFLGSGTYKALSFEEQLFLPTCLSSILQECKVTRNKDDTADLLEAMIKTNTTVLMEEEEKTGIPKFLFALASPIVIACMFLILCLIITYIQYRKGETLSGKIFDFVLFFVFGTFGSLLVYMIIFSEQPYIWPNWNVIWVNPLQLIFLFVFFFRPPSKLFVGYLCLNVVCQILFLSMLTWISQGIEPAFFLLIITMVIRSSWHICYQVLFKK